MKQPKIRCPQCGFVWARQPPPPGVEFPCVGCGARLKLPWRTKPSMFERLRRSIQFQSRN